MTPEGKVLRADRPRALRELVLAGMTQLPLLAAITWLKLSPDFRCDALLGIPGGTVALLTVCYLLPASVAVLLLPLVRLGWHTLQAGENPPPGTAVWRPTAVVTGRAASRRAWLLLALAPCGALLVVMGMKLHDTFAQGRSLAELNAVLAADCHHENARRLPGVRR